MKNKCEICGSVSDVIEVYECACDPNSARTFLCEDCKRKYFDVFRNYRGPSLSLLNGIRFPQNLILAYNTINKDSEKSNKKKEGTMQVTYNGFTGELVKLERKETVIRYDPLVCRGEAEVFVYDLSIYDSEKQVTHSFTGVKLEDVKFLGGAVAFCG